jgi:hypothetical protein
MSTAVSGKMVCGRTRSFWGVMASAVLSALVFAVTAMAQENFLSENFESAEHAFTIVNGSQTNQWVVGETAADTAFTGQKAAYISNNGGTSHAYTVTSASVVHMYVDVKFPYIPATSDPFILTFDLKAVGEYQYYAANRVTLYTDYLRVSLVETSITPVAGTALSNAVGTTFSGAGISSGNANSDWITRSLTFPASNANTTKRLVFSWINNNSGGDQPPAAVDNITLATPPAYTVTSYNKAYTIVNGKLSGGDIYYSVQDAINYIERDANGQSCSIRFGNDTDYLEAENSSASFRAEGWDKKITLLGKIRGTISIYAGVEVESGADITTLINSGTLTVNGGTGSINNAPDGTLTVSDGAVSIYNNAGGTLTVSGGAVSITNLGTTMISGGTVSSVLNGGEGITTISGGTLNSVSNGSGFDFISYTILLSTGTITISGGNISRVTNNGSSSGTILISGGTIDGGTNAAIINRSSEGKIIISGTADIKSSATSASEYKGTVIGGTTDGGTIEITGGTISNISDDGDAIYIDEYNNSSLILGGNPSITGFVTGFSEGEISVIKTGADAFTPQNKTYVLQPSFNSDGAVVVTGAAGFLSNFTLYNVTDYHLQAIGNDLVMKSGKASVASSDRVIPPPQPKEEAVVAAPTKTLAGEFTAGPNPVSRSSGSIAFFWQGRRVSGTLAVYDIAGNVIKKITVNDNALNSQAKRKVGSWDLTDKKGRPAPDGTYLVKGVLKTSDKKSEKVSQVLSVR